MGLRLSLCSSVLAACAALSLVPSLARAQQPMPPQQQQPPPPGWGQQPMPPQQQQPPPGWGQQPMPPQQQPPPGWQPQPQQPQQPQPAWGLPPQQQPPPGWGPPQQPQQQPQSDLRTEDEMPFLYGSAIGYGVGTGVGLDILFGVKDPAVSLIMPLALGAGVPVGFFFLDREMPFHRGVPSSVGTGMMLGAVGGFMLSTTQYTLASSPEGEWGMGTYGALSILSATGGGIGGYAFGEWLRPQPKTLGFIASGGGFGLLTGGMLGAGVSGTDDALKGASLGGLLGYAGGVVASGAMSTFYRPSWNSQKWMWIGYGAGVAATSVVYIAYLATDGEPKRGLIANAFGGLAGLTLAAIFTFNDTDDESKRGKIFTPPFQLGFSQLPTGGGMVTAHGTF